jgi:hypothetical protein
MQQSIILNVTSMSHMKSLRIYIWFKKMFNPSMQTNLSFGTLPINVDMYHLFLEF